MSFSYYMIFAIVFFLMAAFIWLIIEIYKGRHAINYARKNMESFEKSSFLFGFALFVFIPVLKDDPHAKEYIPGIIIDISTALASALFMLGALSFMKLMHNYNNKS